ncbi:MAG TPA: hypothetical protein VKE96_05285 [Vicinamibacterales bacterium]|nr:hypothetical protein [Vicinamibacterales bacterium]
MVRGLSRRLLVVPIAALVVAHATAAATRDGNADGPPILQRFLSLDDQSPASYRALRHFEARNEKFDMSAWMDVWTEVDASGFHYRVVAEEGSDKIRSRVFREALESERKLWATGAEQAASLTPANYLFEDRGVAEGLAALTIKPRRKDVLLVDGSIFLRPEDGDLLKLEGDLAKPPSFWTRHVRIVRQFQRFAGVRLPVSLDAVANLRFFGQSTFHAVYEYETVNAERVGTPQLRAAAR